MPPRSADLALPFLESVLLLGLLGPGSAAMHGQMNTTPTDTLGQPRVGLPRADNDEDPYRNNAGLRERLERGRAADRQRRMVDDANRLVSLTAQYQKALEAHGKPTSDDQKLLMQVEKLARDVKDRMRGM